MIWRCPYLPIWVEWKGATSHSIQVGEITGWMLSYCFLRGGNWKITPWIKRFKLQQIKNGSPIV